MSIIKDFRTYYRSLDKYKKAFWIYLFLLIIEGAMRKCFMPGLSNLWFMCREPIVIWIVISSMNGRYLKSNLAKGFMAIGAVTLFSAITMGHHSIPIALYGFRIWFFHIPFIFIMSQRLNRTDLIKIMQFLCIVFIPMTVLYVLQFLTPPNNIINAAVGGEVAEGTGTANGAVRPPGTFAYCLGSSYYNPIVTCIFAVVMFSNNYRKQILEFKLGFPILTTCVVLTLITSVSRGTILQSAITILFVSLIMTFAKIGNSFFKVLFSLLCLMLLIFIISKIKVGDMYLLDPVINRFTTAAEHEGGTSGIFLSRILEPYIFWHNMGEVADIPFMGYGIGFGSNFAAKAFTGGAWMLGEWSSQIVYAEMGILFGAIVFFMRTCYPIKLFFKSMKTLKKNHDILPITLWTLSLQYFANGNINVVYSLGFIVIHMIMLIVSIKNSHRI